MLEMLENRKNTKRLRKKFLIKIMLVMLILGVYINLGGTRIARLTGIEKLPGQIPTTLAVETINSTGTVNPIYRPQWSKVSSALNTVDKTLTVTVTGSAYASQTINENTNINYESDVYSYLTSSHIKVFIDNEEATGLGIAVSDGTVSTNATTGKREVTHTITLSNFEQAVRQAGKDFKNWSGNVSIKIAGRGEDESTYNNDVLIDEHSNQNMMEVDDPTGQWIDVLFADGNVVQNTNGVMFADYVKPEFTYLYSESDIDYNAKTVKLVFSVVDKYFKSSSLALSDLTIKVDGVDITNVTSVTKTLTQSTEDVTATVNGVENTVIGKTYTLVLSELEQDAIATGKNYLDYSGVVTVAIPAGKVEDNSGNTNNAMTLTVGMDEPGAGDEGSSEGVYIPVGYTQVEGTNLSTGLVIEDSTGNQFVWVEVPQTAEVYPTAGLDITAFTDAELTKIENDLHTYTSVYSSSTHTDTWHEGLAGLTETEYNTQKEKMLKSIYKYGGFYVGRYEAGTTTARTSASDTLTTPVIKQNMYPYNLVKVAQAQELSKSFATTGYISSLMYGVQWNLILKHLETKGAATQAELNSNSVSWGNYLNNLYTITNTNSKYSTDGTTWTEGAYGEKTSTTSVILSTGADNSFVKMGIYDLAGNVAEWTLEYTSNGTTSVTLRGGAYDWSNGKSNAHSDNTTSMATFSSGFRPTLYKDPAEATIVDVVDPLWHTENIQIGSNKVTVDLIATDKYYDAENSEITTNDITIYIDEVEIITTTNVVKSLSEPVALYEDRDGDGTPETQYGEKYTLTLSNWEEAVRQTGKSYLEWSGTTKIKIAQGTKNADGTVISGIVDQSGNTNKEQEFTLGHVDFIQPEIVKVSSTKNDTAKTETIVFTVTDKYYDAEDSTNIVEASDITVYVDDEVANNITKTLTKTPITETRNSSTVTIGHTYTLILSDFEKARNSNNYEDWSGTVSIEIAENTVKDTSNNTNSETLITGDYVDFINPDLKYTHQAVDIDKTNKKYTMTFDITDKYYYEPTAEEITAGQTNKLTIDDLTIQMQNGQKDSDGNAIIYNLKNEPVTITLNATEQRVNDVKITNATTGAVETVSNHLIGYTYTLTISNLEQLERKTGLTTVDYSGIITVAVAGDKVKDRGTAGNNTNVNTNTATTITSGVNIPGGTSPDDATEIDVVDPIWEKVSSTALAKSPSDAVNASATTGTASITFKGTDTYFANSTLTSENIKVLVDGTEVTSGITKTLSTATALTEQRNVFGSSPATTETVQYGVQYTLTISGFVQNANQVKIQLPANTIIDESGNGNKETEFMVYNTLELTNTEGVSNKGFLGSEQDYTDGKLDINIQRKQIENVTFMDNFDSAPITVAGDGTITLGSNCWDVSAQGDKSIIAWHSTGDAPYTVYIASKDEIFANQDSSCLFYAIGFVEDYTNTTTETITNLNLLNTNSVTNMSEMFSHCGYTSMITLDLSSLNTANVTNMRMMFDCYGFKAMTSLSLGDNFDTSNVTDMYYMFGCCGYTAMTSLDLGSKFDTSKVTNMSKMFENCGYTAMTSLNLRDKFDTSNVTDMSYMFHQTGEYELTSLDLSSGTDATNTKQFNTSNVTTMKWMFSYAGKVSMTTLNLGNNFDTSKVTNMDQMFGGTGREALTVLDLGEKFDTSNVTNMENMFSDCGKTAMTTLNLGDKFDTSNVTNMYGMFRRTGMTAMTSLDLGDKFYTTKVGNMEEMFMDCGRSAMTLDLGPAFTKIADTNTSIFSGTGKENSCTIYASESIYKNKNAFKLSSTDTTETPEDLQYTRGTINAIYKPTWEKTSSTTNTTNKTVAITVKGSANKTQTIDSNVSINYASDVTSTLSAEDITVYINGEEAESVQVAIGAGTTSTNATTGKTEVTHVITLSNLEEAVRQAGKQFKEWSGNISIRIGGRGEATSTYTANVLADSYGNQNMMATDETGTWIDVKYEGTGTETANNTTSTTTMFADFIKPEFTYVYSESDIDYTAKTVKIVFSVTDKYFDPTSEIELSDLTIKVDNDDITNVSSVTKTLTEATETIKTTVNGVENTVIGKTYTLLLSELQQDSIGTGKKYLDYSGVVTVAIAGNVVQDLSGNTNNAKTITIGVNEPELSEGSSEGVYIPAGYTQVEGTNLSTGLVIEDSTGNQFVWVEVPQTTTVYQTAGLAITDFTDEELTKIENDLHTYTSVYREDGYIDSWYSEAATGMTETEYNTQKEKMLKSIYTYGGFYVGRYEAGTTTARVSENDSLTTPVVKQNMYPYNLVTNAQAQELSESFSSTGYISSLMYGVQWDLILKHLENHGATQAELTDDSTNWGNYYNNLYTITNTNSKYSTSGNKWINRAYGTKTENGAILLSTGADNSFSKMGIYDLAGNMREHTLEYTSDSSNRCTIRGGECNSYGNYDQASDHLSYISNQGSFNIRIQTCAL